MARRTFGTARKLPSSRWQARYSLDAGDRITAPHTFSTKGDAQRWLATIEADIARGTWHDPTLGHTTIAEWADRWLATKLPRSAGPPPISTSTCSGCTSSRTSETDSSGPSPQLTYRRGSG